MIYDILSTRSSPLEDSQSNRNMARSFSCVFYFTLDRKDGCSKTTWEKKRLESQMALYSLCSTLHLAGALVIKQCSIYIQNRIPFKIQPMLLIYFIALYCSIEQLKDKLLVNSLTLWFRGTLNDYIQYIIHSITLIFI